MKENIKVILKSGKDQSVYRYHPWIFSGAIKKIKGEPQEGEIVDVYNNKEEFLASGHFQIGSIAIRLVTFKKQEINEEFWVKKIENAFRYREAMGLINNSETNVYRLIHAEGDGMPGLIIDYYNGNFVMQMHSIGMHYQRELFAEILQKLYNNQLKSIYDKSKSTLPFKGSVEPKDEFLLGDNDSEVVKEYGNQFGINWVEGQKTGFFIDQRENRKLLGEFSKNKKVLNMFGYTGGFSIFALQGGASLVHSVDSSTKAIDLTNDNVSLNFGETEKHKGFAVDAFSFLDNMEEEYDIIILDPPAFAKHNNVLHNALQGYKRLNQKALEKIKPGGVIFTFSCSQVVNKENFRKSVFAASANAKREVKILHQLSQPVDHPVNIYHPESEYLKGLALWVR